MDLNFQLIFFCKKKNILLISMWFHATTKMLNFEFLRKLKIQYLRIVKQFLTNSPWIIKDFL